MHTPPTAIYTLSLHDALPISQGLMLSIVQLLDLDLAVMDYSQLSRRCATLEVALPRRQKNERSEEHTSELQSRFDLVCRLLLEKKKKKINKGHCKNEHKPKEA